MREWPVPYVVFLCCFFAFEIGLVVRDLVNKRFEGRDRGTRAAIAVGLIAAVVLSWTAPGWLPGLNLPAPRAFAVAGMVVFLTGYSLRIASVLTLGGSFSTFIGVDADQAIVRSGPYRWVRHPSYTGLLLVVVGFGVGSAHALALVMSLLLPLAGIVARIAVEESELVGVIGEPYRQYQRTTRRLVPGIW